MTKRLKDTRTTDEILASITEDPEYQRNMARQEEARQLRVQAEREASEPILTELRELGYPLKSVWDLGNTKDPAPDALAVLMRHLETGKYPDSVREGMLRVIGGKPARAYWERIRTLYVNAEGPKEREAAASALAMLADRSRVDDLIELLQDETLGEDRIFFVRPLLRYGGERGLDVVQSLTEHPLLSAEAVALLKKRDSRRS